MDLITPQKVESMDKQHEKCFMKWDFFEKDAFCNFNLIIFYEITITFIKYTMFYHIFSSILNFVNLYAFITYND